MYSTVLSRSVKLSKRLIRKAKKTSLQVVSRAPPKPKFNPVFKSEYSSDLVAEFNFQKLQAKTTVEADLEANKIMDSAELKYGNSGHTGTFAECCGFYMRQEVFFTEDDAYQWLKENARKWEVMLGVTVKNWNYTAIYVGGWCNSHF